MIVATRYVLHYSYELTDEQAYCLPAQLVSVASFCGGWDRYDIIHINLPTVWPAFLNVIKNDLIRLK